MSERDAALVALASSEEGRAAIAEMVEGAAEGRGRLRVLGHLTLPFMDDSYQLLIVTWYQLPELVAARLRAPDDQVETLARSLLAMSLAGSAQFPGGCGDNLDLARVDGAIPTDHGPWPRELVTADSYVTVEPAAVAGLFVEGIAEWTDEDDDPPKVPEHVRQFIDGCVAPAFARSPVAFGLPDFGRDNSVGWGYGNWDEFVAFDPEARIMLVVVATDD
jgi:hypothetical protein